MVEESMERDERIIHTFRCLVYYIMIKVYIASRHISRMRFKTRGNSFIHIKGVSIYRFNIINIIAAAKHYVA